MREKPKVFIVDIGGSYQKLSENLDGQYIPLTKTDLSLNPFDLLPHERSPSNGKIKFLVGLIDLMTREDGQGTLPRYERAEIEEAIQAVYKESLKPSLSVLREHLLRNEEPIIQRIGKILTPWCGNSPYGKILDRESSIELNKDLVVFDLKGLESTPDLQAVILLIITDFVWREVQKDRKTPKFLVLDECWKLLESESGAAFIGEVFRTFRKYYASAIAISQNLDDFATSKVANAILSNCAARWILSQKGADPTRIKEVLQLNDTELDLISSLRQLRGQYSEAFLIGEYGRGVVVAESNPLEYWIATTDPPDLAEIEKAESNSNNLSRIEILRSLATKFPEGVASRRMDE